MITWCVLRTDGVLDEHNLLRLDEGSHPDDVLGCDPEEVPLPVQKTLNHGVVPGHGVRHRGPAHPVRLSLLDDVVRDGRAAVVLRGIPGEFTRVVGQVLSGERETHRTGDVWGGGDITLVTYLYLL